MPYLLHPDKIATIENLVRANSAAKLNKQVKKPAAPRPGGKPTAGGSPLLMKLAQKLFLERLQKQQGLK